MAAAGGHGRGAALADPGQGSQPANMMCRPARHKAAAAQHAGSLRAVLRFWARRGSQLRCSWRPWGVRWASASHARG